MDETIVKRLHISGLTTQISSTDIQTRFSSFGNVKTLDGLGKLDANGDPRPYAYLTIESTKGQLAKCMNLLSGTTWKGAKLRIGEAKPDYQERIKAENDSVKRAAESDPSRPRKRRRLLRGCKGVLASDMSLVTSLNFAERSLWRKTPLGRLIRPMRMLPGRPLPPPPLPISGGQKLALAASRRKRQKKEKNGLVRQRRKLIDPELWGSEYLKGVMLESGTGVILPDRKVKEQLVPTDLVALAEEQQEMRNELMSPQQNRKLTPSPQPSPRPAPRPIHSTAKETTAKGETIAVRKPPPPPEPTQENDLAREAAQSLSFLATIFGNASEESDWGGAESLSDLDVEISAEAEAKASLPTSGRAMYEEVEIVPRAKVVVKGNGKTRDAVEEESQEIIEEDSQETVEDGVAEVEHGKGEQKTASSALPVTPQKAPAVQIAKLKDMFAPREEDAGFSILNNLEIDLELDETLDIPTTPQPTQSFSNSIPPPTFDRQLVPDMIHPSTLFDPTKPLFFPREASFSSAVTLPLPFGRGKGPKDIITTFQERGWTTNSFCRSESVDDIRKRWESCKVDLTKEWKRRHREAVKSARRRGGVHD